MSSPRAKKRRRYVMISAVAERYDIHPQTLRLYEREGLLNPPRSEGNTRLYDRESLERLESILTLTRDMGVNLAGVEVILRLQDQIRALMLERDQLTNAMRLQRGDRRAGVRRQHALVRVVSGALVPVDDGDESSE